MGVVYEALDEKLNVTRALKCAKVGFRSLLPPEARSALRVTDYARGVSLLHADVFAYAQAIAAFEKASALDSKSALPRAGLAESYYRAWQATNDPAWLTRGTEQLAEAEKRNPDFIAVWLAARKLSLAQVSYDRSAQDFQRAIQLDPASSEAWRGLALVYQAMAGRDNDAVAAFMKAIELQPATSPLGMT